MPGYPVTPLIFIALNTWTILYVMLERPVESLIGFLTVISGIIVYRVNKKFLNKNLTKSLSN